MIFRVARGVILYTASVMLVIGTPAGAISSDVGLGQTIDLINCTTTGASNGYTVVWDVRCDDATMPKITGSSWDKSGELIVKGTYDSLVTNRLRVYALGVWYVLDQDDEIDASGNNWQLKLKKPTVNPGTYNVVVEVVTDNHMLLSGQMDVVVPLDVDISGGGNALGPPIATDGHEAHAGKVGAGQVDGLDTIKDRVGSIDSSGSLAPMWLDRLVDGEGALRVPYLMLSMVPGVMVLLGATCLGIVVITTKRKKSKR